MNNARSSARAGDRWVLRDQVEGGTDKSTLQVYSCIEAAAAKSGKGIEVCWFERVLIILAAVLFIMTVTAQLCIYFKQL
ncbi:MAG: hypothetical protein ABFC94_17065 [Syntrophomonas sp.]